MIVGVGVVVNVGGDEATVGCEGAFIASGAITEVINAVTIPPTVVIIAITTAVSLVLDDVSLFGDELSFEDGSC